MKFKDKLFEMKACGEAAEWVGNRRIKTAWRDCPRADWMLWLAGRLDIDRKLLVLAACDCAETALQYVPEGDDRPSKCIQTTRDWCNGIATIYEVRSARSFYETYETSYPTTASLAAGAADAADAASLAAGAASLASLAAGAAEAASLAADAADAAFARIKALRNCADLVRARIPLDVIETALKGHGDE